MKQLDLRLKVFQSGRAVKLRIKASESTLSQNIANICNYCNGPGICLISKGGLHENITYNLEFGDVLPKLDVKNLTSLNV